MLVLQQTFRLFKIVFIPPPFGGNQVYLKEQQEGKNRTLPSAGSLHKWPLQPGLDQTESILVSHMRDSGHAYGLLSAALPGRQSKELSRKSSQDSAGTEGEAQAQGYLVCLKPPPLSLFMLW